MFTVLFATVVETLRAVPPLQLGAFGVLLALFLLSSALLIHSLGSKRSLQGALSRAKGESNYWRTQASSYANAETERSVVAKSAMAVSPFGVVQQATGARKHTPVPPPLPTLEDVQSKQTLVWQHPGRSRLTPLPGGHSNGPPLPSFARPVTGRVIRRNKALS